MMTLRVSAALAAAFLVVAPNVGAEATESPGAQTSQLQIAAAAAGSSNAEMAAAISRAYAPSTAEYRFYQGRDFAPVWVAEDGSPAAATRALLNWAGTADAHALPASRYHVDALSSRLAAAGTLSAAGMADLELALTRLFVTFGRDMNGGVLDPRSIDKDLDIERHRPDPAAMLEAVATSADPAAYLQTLIPTDPAYRRLLDDYAELRAIARNGDWGPLVEAGGTLKLGDRHPRVGQLRTRLMKLGDLPASAAIGAATEDTVVATNEVVNDAHPVQAAVEANRFDEALDTAVRHFQARHGLSTDGTVGPATLAAINTTAAERATQVAANLERRRWMNYDLGYQHILINLAAFTMTLYEDGRPRFSTRAVVGKAGRHETPEFIDRLEYIVVNPVWNVPRSIATNEILPLLRENPYYLEENNMVLVDSDRPASEIDWNSVSRVPGRIKQRPGDHNALGYVKFLFPNSHSVYMHDTPARKLFARDRRDFSHGCVRLADPYDFAHLLLSMQSGTDDPIAAFDRLRARGGEQWVTLEHPIPVYITYRTVWTDDAGEHQFRADVYRRDREVSDALRAAGVNILG